MDSGLNDYISNARNHGLDDAQIREQLLSAGWQAATVDAHLGGGAAGALQPVDGGTVRVRKGPRTNFLIIGVLVLAAVSAGVYLYLSGILGGSGETGGLAGKREHVGAVTGKSGLSVDSGKDCGEWLFDAALDDYPQYRHYYEFACYIEKAVASGNTIHCITGGMYPADMLKCTTAVAVTSRNLDICEDRTENLWDLEKCVRSYAVLNGDPEACDRLEGMSNGDVLVDMCKQRTAICSGDPDSDLCRREGVEIRACYMPDEAGREMCDRQFSDLNSIILLPSGEQDTVESAGHVDCSKWLTAEELGEMGDRSADRKREIFHELCVVKAAVDSGNPDYCFELESKMDQGACVGMLAITLGDYDLCRDYMIQLSSGSSVCETRYIFDRAAVVGDVGACERIGGVNTEPCIKRFWLCEGDPSDSMCTTYPVSSTAVCDYREKEYADLCWSEFGDLLNRFGIERADTIAAD